MKRHLRIVLVAALAGCATPQNQYFTLSVEPPLTNVSPGPGATEGLSVASVRLPAITDRQQIVVRTGPQTVDVREFDRWAEPLDLMTQRTLSGDLALRGGRPQRGDAPTRLYVVVDEFMADGSGKTLLSGRWWTLGRTQDPASRQEHAFSLSVPIQHAQSAEVAAAMSQVLGHLATEIVQN